MAVIQDDDRVSAAAGWLAEQSEQPARVVRIIREKFDLSALQACEACALAADIRQNAGART